MKAFLFPGQGSQFPGMGKDLFEAGGAAAELMQEADRILGYSLTKVMFEGTAEELKETKITQPAIFLHSIATMQARPPAEIPAAAAGHSLGEFSALVAAKAMDFESGLKLVAQRAMAMQKACEHTEGTMAAVLGMEDAQVEDICGEINKVVVPANYNCPGQLVISGSTAGIEAAAEALKAAGAKRVLVLPVGGAFHSPLMSPAKEELRSAIEATDFKEPECHIYQNVDALPTTDPEKIQANLIQQLDSPVRWTQTMMNMLAAGMTHFTEVGGSGRVLQGMLKKVDRSISSESL